jgi:hypothetical protein
MGSLSVPNPAKDVARIVKQDEDAGPLNSSETEEDAGIRLDEVAEQAEGHVGDHEEFEGVAGLPTVRTPSLAGGGVGGGVLRLRIRFASRRGCFAQDDNLL